MRYSTIVEKDDKTLLEIIDMLEQFEKDKFIAGLQMRHYSLFQIEQTLDMVRSYQARMNIESRALVNFSERDYRLEEQVQWRQEPFRSKCQNNNRCI